MNPLRGKIAFILAALLLFSAALGGCSLKKKSGDRQPMNPRGDGVAEEGSSVTAIREPFKLTAKTMSAEGCIAQYPYVLDEHTVLLNMSIEKAFRDFAGDCESQGGRITYSVEFNRFGLLSVLMTCTIPGGKELYSRAANFDSDTGRQVFLSDCFGSGEAGHASRLEELVAGSVDSSGSTLLAVQPPISDDTDFIFAPDGICLLFREYELFTYDAGAPRISITLDELADCIQPDGLLNRLSSAAD